MISHGLYARKRHELYTKRHELPLLFSDALSRYPCESQNIFLTHEAYAHMSVND